MAYSEVGAHVALAQFLSDLFETSSEEQARRFISFSRLQTEAIYERAYKDVLHGGVVEVHSHEKEEGMNPNTGEVYESMEDALAAGEDIRDLVTVTGSRENVEKVATALRKAKRRAQKQARRKTDE